MDVLAQVQERPQHYDNIKAPWFVLTAKQELERRKGANVVKLGGWKVITTLDLNAQKVAEEQVAKGLAQVKRQGGDTAAFVAEDVKTGQVVALVGGDDFKNTTYGENNYAHDLELPPGSTFKPYDYAALIDVGKTLEQDQFYMTRWERCLVRITNVLQALNETATVLLTTI